MACSEKIGDITYLQNQLKIARDEVNNLRQQLKSLTYSSKRDWDKITQKLNNWRCAGCRETQSKVSESVLQIDHCYDLNLSYIGTIYTDFPDKRGTPRQPVICAHMVAKLILNKDIFTNPGHALDGLQEFSHMWILFHFDRNDSAHLHAKVTPPRLNGQRLGVFATRSPHRPCAIGMSLVKIDRVMGNTIYFSGVDMIDQTPVLDIKPYIPHYDNPAHFSLNDETTLDSGSRESILECSEYSTENLPEEQRSDRLDNRDISDNSTNGRLMDGEANGGEICRTQNLGPNGDTFFSRSISRIGEREAPDGEEETDEQSQAQALPPSSSMNTHQTHHDCFTSRNSHSSDDEDIDRPDLPKCSKCVKVAEVRIPSWIEECNTRKLCVIFKDTVKAQFNSLGLTTEERNEKIMVITNVLKEDPRSVYLRERLGNNCYVFRIAALYVSCKFNDVEKTVRVFKVSHMSDLSIEQ